MVLAGVSCTLLLLLFHNFTISGILAGQNRIKLNDKTLWLLQATQCQDLQMSWTTVRDLMLFSVHSIGGLFEFVKDFNQKQVYTQLTQQSNVLKVKVWWTGSRSHFVLTLQRILNYLNQWNQWPEQQKYSMVHVKLSKHIKLWSSLLLSAVPGSCSLSLFSFSAPPVS